ncbi:P-loop containing nucleoside triphosphate hydrolase protein, partial [Piptocephalis cylindrospora]
CAICLDKDLSSVRMTPCAHVFCNDCFFRWTRQHRHCPICRRSLPNPEGVSLISLTSKGRPKGRVNESNRSLGHIPIYKREFGRGRDKVVIFTQFPRILDLFIPIFQDHGITFVSFSGRHRGAAVSRFSEDPTIQVFLLAGNAQSSGVTLVGAQHLILYEPIVNPSVELQIINRIHRIGQTRETHVYTYLTRGTVEERMMRIRG